MTRVGIFTRTTPDGPHPHREIALLRQVADANGWIETGVFVDDNGTDLRELLQAAGEGTFHIVLVWSLDRLTRSPHTFFSIYKRLNNANIRLVAVDPPFGVTRPRRSLSKEPAVRQLIEDFEAEREWVFDHGLATRPSKGLR
jgi:hypothetical protein